MPESSSSQMKRKENDEEKNILYIKKYIYVYVYVCMYGEVSRVQEMGERSQKESANALAVSESLCVCVCEHPFLRICVCVCWQGQQTPMHSGEDVARRMRKKWQRKEVTDCKILYERGLPDLLFLRRNGFK